MSDTTTEYIVTTCVLHGEKVTSDRASARHYRRVVLDCIDGFQAHLHEGEGKGVRQAHADHEAEHGEGVSCWVCCELMDVTEYPDEIGDIVIGSDGTGHRMSFEVVGFYPDGTTRTGPAIDHQDDCACGNPEEWY